MSLKILIVAATAAEAETFQMLPGIKVIPGGYSFNDNEFGLLITGVGPVATAWSMTKQVSAGNRYDLAVNIGIAGSYRDDLAIGETVIPVSDCFADSGIETPDGFLTLEEAGIEDPERFPFRGGRLIAENFYTTEAVKILKPVHAVTVNRASGSLKSINVITGKYHPDIETMEGAAFFYVCLKEKIPFLALRSISNKVETRNTDKWNIPLAIANLSMTLKDILIFFE
jgi:futalosine hydrolase